MDQRVTDQYVLGSLASQAGLGAGLAVLMLMATVRTAEDAVLPGSPGAAHHFSEAAGAQ